MPEPPGQPHHHARPVETHKLHVAGDAYRCVLSIVAKQRAQLALRLHGHGKTAAKQGRGKYDTYAHLEVPLRQ